MKKFNLDHLPNYKKFIESQPHIINSDFEPILLKNVLTQDQINKIIKDINNTPEEKVRVQKWGGQGCYDTVRLDKEITSKINWLIDNSIGEQFKLEHYSVIRYAKKYGYQVKLFPHHDTRYAEMFVLDLQLRSNEEWGIIVEGEKYNLNDNEALIFSGTQQMHWREKKDLQDSTEIDMIFFWFSHKTPRIKPEGHEELMHQRAGILMQETDINNFEIEVDNG